MAETVQLYGEKRPASVAASRTPEELPEEYEEKVNMGLCMYYNGATALLVSAGYEPPRKNETL